MLLRKVLEKQRQYLFLGLKDDEKNKELHYMMGVFIDDREEFDKAWDSEEY